jgi:hypothetical protein
MEYVKFFSGLHCRFFALGPLLPTNGVEIAVPVKSRDLPAGTARIKVLNAAGTYVGGWKIDISHQDPDMELELPLLALRK